MYWTRILFRLNLLTLILDTLPEEIQITFSDVSNHTAYSAVIKKSMLKEVSIVYHTNKKDLATLPIM